MTSKTETPTAGDAFNAYVGRFIKRRKNSRLYHCAIEGKETDHSVAFQGNYTVFTCLTPGCYHSKAVQDR